MNNDETSYLFCPRADFFCVFLRIILFLAHYPPERVSESSSVRSGVFEGRIECVCAAEVEKFSRELIVA